MSKAQANTSFEIGTRLKSARLMRRLSQRELARKSGVTNGLISQIEQNHSSPSVSTLKRILDAIPMSLTDFFTEESQGDAQVFFRADELHELNPSQIFDQMAGGQNRISLRQVGFGGDHSIQMLHETYGPGADTGPGLYSHSAEETGIIIAGHIEITAGEHVKTLGPGDAYLFDSRMPHRFHNTGSEDCVIISACTPPSF